MRRIGRLHQLSGLVIGPGKRQDAPGRIDRNQLEAFGAGADVRSAVEKPRLAIANARSKKCSIQEFPGIRPIETSDDHRLQEARFKVP
jgi:hypothetical protein